MRIGLIGTGGTGKTSLIKALNGTITYVPSVVRGVFQEMSYSGEAEQRRMSEEDKWLLQKRIFDRKVEQDTRAEDGIYDRTLIDHMAYCLFRADASMPNDIADAMLKQALKNVFSYEQIYYCPLYDWPPEKDGFREDHRAYRMAIAAIMLGLLTQSGRTYRVMPDISVEERAKLVHDNYIAAISG